MDQKYNRDFHRVIQSTNDEDSGPRQIKQWYQLHAPRQVRHLGNVIGQEMRDSVQAVLVQLGDIVLAGQLLRVKNLSFFAYQAMVMAHYKPAFIKGDTGRSPNYVT